MFLANWKHVKGLRTTGVGGVTCTQHNMWRPNGIGDLQLGERQCNTDFILLSALLNAIIFYLILLYDIACQYGKNFWMRMPLLPSAMHLVIEQAWVWFKVPNFHLPLHLPTCHSAFSFHYITFHELIVAPTLTPDLARPYTDLITGEIIQPHIAQDNSASSPHASDGQPESDWESRQHKDGTESPFELKEKVMTMQDITRKLQRDELLWSGERTEVEQEDTPSTFILMGLELEELQFPQAAYNAAQAHTGVPQAPADHTIWDAEAERNAEAIRLFMPSDLLDVTKCVKACAVGLPEVEESLRVGEARQALDDLRQGLRTRTMTNRFHLQNCTGQRMLTRGQGILRQVNIKIHKAKIQYQYVRNTLKRLKGNGPWEKELPVLEDSDIRTLNERALTAEEAEQQQAIHDYEEIAEEGGVAAFGVVALAEGRRTLSWIWYVAKAEDPTEAELVEALRVEWCKVFARMRRWREDVVLEDREMWMSHQLAANWTGIRMKGRAYLAGETPAGVEIVLWLDDDDAGDDGEKGTPDYEDEGDDEVFE
ncbi:hypothetical protein C8F01DRAFT_1360484 [Mycena amicta]|nr:hypothetical protein C8F01DRAFT_1360484 [Mycena amicta]